MHRSRKVIDGFSTTFRQHRANFTHCKFLHGYAISFVLTFEGHLDHRNWVVDFGGFKRSDVTISGLPPKDWFNYMFDHTTIIAEDDPELEYFKEAERKGLIRLRILKDTGCEKFAEYVHKKLNEWVAKETGGRCWLLSVECKENDKNSAIFGL